MGVRSLAGPVLCLVAAPGLALAEPAALRLVWSASSDARESDAPLSRPTPPVSPVLSKPRLQLRYRLSERVDVTLGKAAPQSQRASVAPAGGGVRVGLNLRW